MIDVKQPLRTAYYSLLAGHIVYNAQIVPVSDSVEKLADKVDIYVLFTQQNGSEQNTQQSWNSLETIMIDIVSRGTRVSKNTVDNIASQIFTLLFPNPAQNALPTQPGIYIGNCRVTDDRYLVFGQVGGKNVTRRLITTTQLVTQQSSGTGYVAPGVPSIPGTSTETILADATDANFTMTADATIYLPSGTLTGDKTITIPTGTAGQYMKFYNNEAGFTWLLSGIPIYLSDGATIVTQLQANTNYLIEFISGKWRILN